MEDDVQQWRRYKHIFDTLDEQDRLAIRQEMGYETAYIVHGRVGVMHGTGGTGESGSNMKDETDKSTVEPMVGDMRGLRRTGPIIVKNEPTTDKLVELTKGWFEKYLKRTSRSVTPARQRDIQDFRIYEQVCTLADVTETGEEGAIRIQPDVRLISKTDNAVDYTRKLMRRFENSGSILAREYVVTTMENIAWSDKLWEPTVIWKGLIVTPDNEETRRRMNPEHEEREPPRGIRRLRPETSRD